MKQEVWITLRFKGEADAELDSDKMAEDMLRTLEKYIDGRPDGLIHGFERVVPGDVVEVEEEAEIYGNT